jgi:N-acetylmuramoyl-L-alanine amidase
MLRIMLRIKAALLRGIIGPGRLVGGISAGRTPLPLPRHQVAITPAVLEPGQGSAGARLGRSGVVTVHHRRSPALGWVRLGWVFAAGAVAVSASACGASAGPTPVHTAAAATASPSGPRRSVEHAGRTAAPGARPKSSAALPLAGKIVGIDPGHNGRNYADPAYIDHQIWNGREWEDCNTTGTETDGGYAEALFNFNVASFLRADLVHDGARVVMTRASNDGVGPCVNTRAQIINDSHANVAVAIHADGGPPSGRGFAILEPVADGPNDAVITSSERFGADVRQAFLSGTSMPESTYDGVDGIADRDNLAGLNLTRVSEVLVECGNMRNATDAALLTTTAFQGSVARALEAAIIRFLS